MLSSATVAAILALSAPALATNSGWRDIEAINIATGNSLGYIWSEPNGLQYPNSVYGDERFDFMFRKGTDNNKMVEVLDEPADAQMRCAREGPSPCSGTAYFDVGGGEWEAGNYLVQGGFRYSGTPNYTIDDEFLVDNYSNVTGKATFEYVGSNSRNEPYAYYACGDIPVTENDEPSGDLYIKYASFPTPDDCQDVVLQAQFQIGTSSLNWTKPYECVAYFDGIC